MQRLAAHACPELAGLDCSLKISLISPLHARGYLVQNSGLMGVRWWAKKCPKGSSTRCGFVKQVRCMVEGCDSYLRTKNGMDP